MATISQNSNFNWMSLAKIFLNGVKQKQPAPKKMRSTTSRQKSQSFRKMSRKINTNNVSNCDLHEEQMAVISRFETLRKQLLHQLLVYQKELLALKMPVLPSKSVLQPGLQSKQKQKSNLKQMQIYPRKKYTKIECKKCEKTFEVNSLYSRQNQLSKKLVNQQFKSKGRQPPLLRREKPASISVPTVDTNDTKIINKLNCRIGKSNPTNYVSKIHKYISENTYNNTSSGGRNFTHRPSREKPFTSASNVIYKGDKLKYNKDFHHRYTRNIHKLNEGNTKSGFSKTVNLNSFA
ncbi:uncharacterized protein LOC124353085 [Homalodisca vitripennis]|uniref:uncharacterized protein LOC124353085 n=1 Tax=Homalodisca vitripennis TaxID=197043 RepID=UPI001EEA7D2C|nr:uncharacterized protein LOC124353085 [Homalodisca vitripennis]